MKTTPGALAPLPSINSASWLQHWRALAAGVLAVAATAILAASCGSHGGIGSCSVNGRQCATGCAEGVGCGQCAIDSDCNPPAGPFCVLGACVACRTSSDCGTGQACFPRNHTCQATCTTNAQCGTNGAPICDTSAGACVGCQKSSDCSGGQPVCEPTRGQCAQCAGNGDCGAAAPICDVQAGECRQCLVDSDCQSGFLCGGNGRCRAGCKLDADCTEGARPICDTSSGACVGCRSAADCGAAAPICGLENVCVRCQMDSDCPVTTPRCDAQGRCGQ